MLRISGLVISRMAMAARAFSPDDVLPFLLGADDDAAHDEAGLGALPRVFRSSEVPRSTLRFCLGRSQLYVFWPRWQGVEDWRMAMGVRKCEGGRRGACSVGPHAVLAHTARSSLALLICVKRHFRT
jgi:hypothetical protein